MEKISGRCLVLCLVLTSSFLVACSSRVEQASESLKSEPAAIADLSAPLATIAFGSCLDQDKEAPILQAIHQADPDLLLLIGDNVYADTEDQLALRRTYDRLASRDDFGSLRRDIPILGTWDDHDYGANDAGADFPAKEASKEEFLRFFNVARDDPRRQRTGIYHSRTFGPEGRRTQIILLDTRSFRGPLLLNDGTGPGRFVPDPSPDAEFLGEEQWQWLGQTLLEPAELRLLVSSVQVIAGEHGWESWSNFPAERQRLLALIESTAASGVLILSGDRHLAEISRLGGAEGPGYALYDITSSSLNRPGGGQNDEPNRHRVAGVYQDENFGWIEIDWASPAPTVGVEIRDVLGSVVSKVRVELADLRF